MSAGTEPAAAPSRAGRPLVAATVVALLLLALLGVTLLLPGPAFTIVVIAGIIVAVIEVVRALTAAGYRIATPALLVAAVLLPIGAYVDSAEGLAAAFLLALPVVLLWRAVDGGEHAARDTLAGVLVLVWIPLLASFLVLLSIEDDGPARVLTLVLVTAASDTGGYLVGVLFGRHPMAPTVSPKKSWEGFVGSVVACQVVGIACAALLLRAPLWVGVLLGALAVITATLGDLGESLIKRDLAIKDMSHLLPGHGGLLDRVDSLLVTAPVVWIVLTLLVPVLS